MSQNVCSFCGYYHLPGAECKPKTATEAIKDYGNRDLLRDTLRSSLRHSFLIAGYEDEEACKLVEIAIGPIHHALDLAHQAYKLHIEALNIQPQPPWVQK